jgi:hypothetical protein
MTALAVASADVVLRKICGTCARRRDLDVGQHSYAFTCRPDPTRPQIERLFFIPCELTAGGYTGFDLLPLDHHLH